MLLYCGEFFFIAGCEFFFIARCEQTLGRGLVNTSTEVWARSRSCKLLWSKSPGVNSNINDTPRSPWYKTKWSHLLSSGMQLQAVKAFHILKMANHKRDLERVLWRSRQSFLWRVLFSICEKLSLLAVASHYSKMAPFCFVPGTSGSVINVWRQIFLWRVLFSGSHELLEDSAKYNEYILQSLVI